MKNYYLSEEEKEINAKIDAGIIVPLNMPWIITPTDILKYQLCTEIIRFKKRKELMQIDLAKMLDINKSEISKICSYNLSEFSSDRLIGMIETLQKLGAEINLSYVFTEVSKRIILLAKKNKAEKKQKSARP